MWRRRWPYLVMALAGVMYVAVTVLANPGLWDWRSGAAWVWRRVGGTLQDQPRSGLHTIGLLSTDEGFIAHGIMFPHCLSADILQQTVGSIAHLFGAGADRYAAFRQVLQILGPTASLALWLTTSALVGAGMGVAALALGRLLFRLARKAAEIPEEK